MSNHGISQYSYQLIIETLSNEEQILQAVLYGSRAMGNARKGSDIDIAIKASTISYELINALSTKLNQELPIPYHVDVQHYDTIKNEALKKHIDDYGQIIYQKQQIQ
ncbi:MAG: nucleotidyltransferase domain-containing protein [Bacteroidales bacterium]|nr:nucleotidyltransferase domain-containing protein [Bacteroidales bacterium]MCF8375864.1 nucleotidyltransferase domain-containing protein [Bacteroidales bacterium]